MALAPHLQKYVDEPITATPISNEVRKIAGLPEDPNAVPDRSLAGDVAAAAGRGWYGAQKMLGGAAKAFSPVGSAMYEKGEEVEWAAKADLEQPSLREGRERGFGVSTLIKGVEAVAQMAPVLAASAIPGAGQVLGSAAALAIYSGSTYQDTKERMLKQEGLDDAYAAANPNDPRVKKANMTSLATGVVQGVSAAAATAVGGKFITATMPNLGKTTAQSLIKTLKNPGSDAAIKFLKGWGVAGATEAATEPLQDETQAYIERQAGLKDAPKFLEQFKDSAQGGLGAALLLGPLAGLSHANAYRKAKAINIALTDPSVDPALRDIAASMVAEDLAKTDPQAAANFQTHAYDAINGEQLTGTKPYGLNLDDDSIITTTKTPVPAAEASPVLEALQDIANPETDTKTVAEAVAKQIGETAVQEEQAIADALGIEQQKISELAQQRLAVPEERKTKINELLATMTTSEINALLESSDLSPVNRSLVNTELDRREAELRVAPQGQTSTITESSRRTNEDGTQSVAFNIADNAGHANVNIATDNTAHLTDIQIGYDTNSPNRGKGNGIQSYREIGAALAESGVALESTQWSKHYTAISPQALSVWSRLEAEGLAEQIGVEKSAKVYDRLTGVEEIRDVPIYRWKMSAETAQTTPQETLTADEVQPQEVDQIQPVADAVNIGAVSVKQDSISKGVERANTLLSMNSGAMSNSDVLANHPAYDGSFDIPVTGGIQAAKSSEKYQSDPVYAAQIDAFESELNHNTYILNKQKRILEQHTTPTTDLSSSEQPTGTGVKSKYNVDVRGIWNSEAKMTYGGYSLGNIAVREMLQNSMDAVIVAMRRGLIKKGAIALDIDPSKGRIAIEDNGIGMSAQDVGDRFLTLANQSKNALGESVFGGFGAAKAVILGWGQKTNWKLWSRDVYTDSDITASEGDVQFSDKPRVGTKLETFADPDGEYDMWESFDRSSLPIYSRYSVMPKGVNISLNGAAVKAPTMGTKAGSDTQEFNDGATTITTTVYNHTLPDLGEGQVVLRLYDPTTGAKLVQGLDTIYDFKGTAIVDITTTLKPGDHGYPFTTSRNSLDYGRVRNAVNGYIESFKPKPKEDKKDTTEVTESDLTSSPSWRTALNKLRKDPEYLKIQELIAAYSAANSKSLGPNFLSTLEEWVVKKEKKAKLPVGSVGMLKLAVVYEAALRTAALENYIPVGTFKILDYSEKNSIAANFGNGSTGFNTRGFDYSLIDKPSELKHYIKALADHEITHYYNKDHDQNFANSLVANARNSGTELNWNLLSDMVDVITGNTKPVDVVADEQRIDELAQGEVINPEPIIKYIGEEQYELFNQTNKIELFNPYATDEQLSLDFAGEPRRDTTRDEGGSGDVVGDKSERSRGKTGTTKTGRSVQPRETGTPQFSDEQVNEFLKLLKGKADPKGRAEVMDQVKTKLTKLEEQVEDGLVSAEEAQQELTEYNQIIAMLEYVEQSRGVAIKSVKMSEKGGTDGSSTGANTTTAKLVKKYGSPAMSTWSERDRLEAINSSILDENGKNIPVGTYKASENIALRNKLAKIAGIFGHEVTLIADTKYRDSIGFILEGDKKHIYIFDIANGIPPTIVLGHEILHQLKRTDKNLYVELRNSLWGLRDQLNVDKYFNEYHKKDIADSEASDKAAEEWVGDVFGISMNHKTFWDKFYEKSPTVAARVATFVHGLIQKLKDKLLSGRAGLAAATIKDFKAADTLAAGIAQKYAKQREKQKVLDDIRKSVGLPMAEEFTRVMMSDNPTPAVKSLLKPAKRIMKDFANKAYRYFMPLDRVLTLAASQKEYAPIAGQLKEYMRLKKEKSGYVMAAMENGWYEVKEIQKVFKTDADQKKLKELVFNATLWELHANGDPSGWTAESWVDAGMLEQTKMSRDEAQAEINAQYANLTDPQKAAHKAMLKQISKMYEDGRKAALAPYAYLYGEEAVKAAEAYNVDYYAEQADSFKYKRDIRPPAGEADVKNLAEIVRGIDRQFPKLRGDYFPLMRFGDIMVRVNAIDENGELGKRKSLFMFDSQQEALDFVDRTNSNPAAGEHAVIESNKKMSRDAVNIPSELMDKLKGLSDRRFKQQNPEASQDEINRHNEELENLIRDAEALRISMMPRLATQGNRLKREGVEGYNENVLKVFTNYITNHANANAGLIYGTKIERNFRDMANAIKAYTSENNKVQDGVNYDPKAALDMSDLQKSLYDSEKTASKIRLNKAVKAAGKLSFLWYLSSPSIWAVQWSQPFMITVPQLASRYGYTKSLKKYSEAAGRYLAGDFSDEKITEFNRKNNVGETIYNLIEKRRQALPKELEAIDAEIQELYNGIEGDANKRLAVLKVLSLQGMIDLSASHEFRDLAESSNTSGSTYNKLKNVSSWVQDKASVFMRHSETGSRRAAAIAAFEMALEKDGVAKANDYAVDVINDTLYNMSSENRGEAWRGNAGHIFGQFQFFRLHTLGKMLQLMKNSYGSEARDVINSKSATEAEKKEAQKRLTESRKELAFMTVTSLALAGAGGTPIALVLGNSGVSALLDAIGFMFGDDDEPWDIKRDFEQFVREHAGDTAGNAFLKGIPYLFGMDISKRIGLGNMGDIVNGEPPAGVSATAKANWYAGRLLGPAWGIASDGIKAGDALADGNMADAVKYSSPKVVRDFMRMYEISDKGVTSGGKTILQAEDVTPMSYALMMVGINPADISLASEESRYLKNISASLAHRRSLLMKGMAEAVAEGDYDKKMDFTEKINAWAGKQPQLKITQQELATAVRKQLRLSQGKLSPREKIVQDKYGMEGGG